MEGFDIGRWFLSCPLEVSANISQVNALCSTGLMVHTNIYHSQGYGACAFVKWLDDDSEGRARSVITKLAEDNGELNKKVADMECTITRLKLERIKHR